MYGLLYLTELLAKIFPWKCYKNPGYSQGFWLYLNDAKALLLKKTSIFLIDHGEVQPISEALDFNFND